VLPIHNCFYTKQFLIPFKTIFIYPTVTFDMSDQERKGSNVTPKLKLVATPVKSRSTTKVKPLANSDGNSNKNIQDINDIDIDVLYELPAFERHEESTAIELFYDLFFVANLTTFSSIHEINDANTLKSYIGFFCILWFTWCLTSLYDIRFITDSLVARVTKGAHLGVMVGLAISGPKFDTLYQNSELQVMGIIDLIVFTQRLNN
jgi:hypothetical protein